MDFPKIRHAGGYRHAQKRSQTCHAIHLGLFVKGLVRCCTYYPDGSLCEQIEAANGNFVPRLSLSMPDFRFIFEFDSSRENWVVMLNFPALHWNPEVRRICWDYNGHSLPVPRTIPVTEAECSAYRNTFDNLCRLHQSALPQNMLEAELIVMQILHRFLQSGAPPDDAVEQFRKRLIEDSLWHYSIAEHCRILGVNRDLLRRDFYARYNIEPGEYRIQLRYQKILSLLTYSGLSLKEIAFKTGMKNQSYLSSFIRKRSGKTPSELSREYREKDRSKNSPASQPGQPTSAWGIPDMICSFN